MNNDEIIDKGADVMEKMMDDCQRSEATTLEDEYCSDEGCCERHWKAYQNWLCNEARRQERRKCIKVFDEVLSNIIGEWECQNIKPREAWESSMQRKLYEANNAIKLAKLQEPAKREEGSGQFGLGDFTLRMKP